MKKKYEITGVEEPVNKLEEKRAKESKKFGKTLIKLSVAYSSDIILIALTARAIDNAILTNNPNDIVAVSFFSGMAMLSACLAFHASQDLFNLYDERETKEDKVEVDENDSKETTKCLKK